MKKIMSQLKQKIRMLKHANEMYEALTQIQVAIYTEQVPVSEIPRIAFSTQEIDLVLKKINR